MILSHLDQFKEASVAFAKTLKLAPREAKPELEGAIARMHQSEAQIKLATEGRRSTPEYPPARLSEASRLSQDEPT